MKILKNVVYGIAALIALMAVIGLVALPRNSQVVRSLAINAPASVIFDQVNDLKKNEAWSPWKDPTMQITYGAVTEGKGASSSWVSDKMGKGTMTIAESVPASSINLDLDFGGMGSAKAIWTFVPEGDAVKVTEVMASDAGMNPMKRWMSLLSDKMVGGYFEKGLAALKQVSETRAAELKTEQAETQQAAAELTLKGEEAEMHGAAPIPPASAPAPKTP